MIGALQEQFPLEKSGDSARFVPEIAEKSISATDNGRLTWKSRHVTDALTQSGQCATTWLEIDRFLMVTEPRISRIRVIHGR